MAAYLGDPSASLSLVGHAARLLSWASIAKQPLRRVSGLGRSILVIRGLTVHSVFPSDRKRPKADSALAEKQQPIYAGAASTMLTSDPVGTTFDSRKSALRNRVPYSSPVRS